MTKNAKRIFMLVGGGILALLIVLALFGNTYARYTSAGEGDAAVSVALWDVESVPVTVSGQSLSPSMSEYKGGRENASAWEKAFTVNNQSDVSGRIYPEADYVGFSWKKGFSWDTGWTADNGTNSYGKKLMAHFDVDENGTGEYWFRTIVEEYGVFMLQTGLELNLLTDEEIDKFYGDAGHPLGDSGEIDESVWVEKCEDTDLLFDSPEVGVLLNEVKPDDDMNVYVRVVWVSVYEGEAIDGHRPTDFGFETWAEFSDAVDTILCMYADEISFVVSLNTVQSSTLP